jgi:hypothetical protein
VLIPHSKEGEKKAYAKNKNIRGYNPSFFSVILFKNG